MTKKNNLGIFDSFDEVYAKYPEGGYDGDYFIIEGYEYYWDEFNRCWAAPGVSPKPTEDNLTVNRTLTVGGKAAIKTIKSLDGTVTVEDPMRLPKGVVGDLIVEGSLKARHVRQPNCGLFASVEQLKNIYPNPEVGMWATIGDTIPGDIWRCQVSGHWEPTGEKGGAETVDLANYVPKSSITDVLGNSGEKITSQKLINDLFNEGYLYAGIAQLNTTPFTTQSKVFYLANSVGVYEYFNITLTSNNVSVFMKEEDVWKAITLFDIAEIDTAKKDAIDSINDLEVKILAKFSSQQVTPDMLSQSTLDLIHASGGGTITNLPDDEDLTSTGGEAPVLKFANKAHDKSKFSGLGRVYLRKNITKSAKATGDLELKNILTQAMINLPSTIYIIQYDFDLNGATINVPENCTLKFEGGSLNNGTLHGNKTRIEINYDSVIFNDVKISNITNTEIPVIWFGIFPDNKDNYNKLQYLLSLGKKLLFTIKGDYIVSQSLLMSPYSGIKAVDVETYIKYTGDQQAISMNYKSSIENISIIIDPTIAKSAIDIDTAKITKYDGKKLWGVNTKISHVYIYGSTSNYTNLKSIGINILVRKGDVTSAISYLPYFNDIYIHLMDIGIKIYNDGTGAESKQVWSNSISFSNIVLNSNKGIVCGKKEGYIYDSTGNYFFNTILYQSIKNITAIDGCGMDIEGLSCVFNNLLIFDTNNNGVLKNGASILINGASFAVGGYYSDDKTIYYGFKKDVSSTLIINSFRKSSYITLMKENYNNTAQGTPNDNLIFFDYTKENKVEKQIIGGPIYDHGVRVKHGERTEKNNDLNIFGTQVTRLDHDIILAGLPTIRKSAYYTGYFDSIRKDNYWDIYNSFFYINKNHQNYYNYIHQLQYNIYNIRIFIEKELSSYTTIKIPIAFKFYPELNQDTKIKLNILNISSYSVQYDKTVTSNVISAISSPSFNAKEIKTLSIQNIGEYKSTSHIIDILVKVEKSVQDKDITIYPEGTNTYDKIPKLDQELFGCKLEDVILDFVKEESINNRVKDFKNLNGAIGDGFTMSNNTDNRLLHKSNRIICDSEGNPADALREGPTASRPTNVRDRFQYFDTTINKYIWKHGNSWIDANGNTV